MAKRDSALPDLFSQSPFVFVGNVVRAGTNVRQLARTENAAIIQVRDILKSSRAMRGPAGREVTLVHDEGGAPEPGNVSLFFARGLAYGEAVALREIGRTTASREALDEVARLTKEAETKPIEARVSGAELIVQGRVVGLRAAETSSTPKSEHDPQWWIATVEVTAVLRGKKPPRAIEIWFPNSRDIAWHKAPKLHAGDSGILISRRRETGRKGKRGEELAVTDPFDFLPADQIEVVKRALATRRG